MTDATDPKHSKHVSDAGPSGRAPLHSAAQRALAEAEERRRAGAVVAGRPIEIDGPKGPEPVRYGDWDVNGRASDF